MKIPILNTVLILIRLITIWLSWNLTTLRFIRFLWYTIALIPVPLNHYQYLWSPLNQQLPALLPFQSPNPYPSSWKNNVLKIFDPSLYPRSWESSVLTLLVCQFICLLRAIWMSRDILRPNPVISYRPDHILSPLPDQSQNQNYALKSNC